MTMEVASEEEAEVMVLPKLNIQQSEARYPLNYQILLSLQKFLVSNAGWLFSINIMKHKMFYISSRKHFANPVDKIKCL